MEQQDFQAYIDSHRSEIEQIQQSAHQLHASVNQTYDKVHPYGHHLDMVAESVFRFGHLVCVDEQDILPLFFGAYYHDSIEDARLTYNDAIQAALHYMNEQQAHMAAEIVYALTNDKGRTRAERSGEKYYQGIRETPYAPFMKLADRVANANYSFTHANASNLHMQEVYRNEMPHFLSAIRVDSSDPRFSLPQPMINQIVS